MPSFIRNTSGGKAISGGALAPRSRRGNAVAQVDAYWRGGVSGPDATGGVGAPLSTGLGYNYLRFHATGTLTVVSAGTFEFKCFGGGGAGWGGNGYNAFGAGGAKGGEGNLTVTLPVGTYTVVVGSGSTNPASYPYNYYPAGSGGSSYLTGYTAGSEVGAGGSNGQNPGGLDANGVAGTQVNTFIGGSSLFKAAGGGNSRTGIGGSGIGGNGVNNGTATGAAANTASGGGGAGGSSQPNLYSANAGVGGSGIVYVRWLA